MSFEPLTKENVKDFPNFTYNEFACKCDGKYCNGFPVPFSYELARILQMIRDHFNSPVIITSAVRCNQHNKNVGGVSNSRHKKGTAVDFYVEGISYDTLAKYVKSLPFYNYCYNITGDVMHLQIDPPDEDLIIKPVGRDINKDQLKVLVVNLQVRREPSLSSDIRGYVKTNAIYNYYGVKQNDGYTWYQIDDIQWIPSNGSWLEILPKGEDEKVIEELQKELEEANKQIEELEVKNSNLDTLNKALQEENNKLANDLDKFEKIYTCEKDDYYKFRIKLYKDESLYIK